jgi:hypothetical protein
MEDKATLTDVFRVGYDAGYKIGFADGQRSTWQEVKKDLQDIPQE